MNSIVSYVLESKLVSFRFVVLSDTEVRVERFDRALQQIVASTKMPKAEAQSVYKQVRNTVGFYPVNVQPAVVPEVKPSTLFKDVLKVTKATKVTKAA